MGSSVPVMDLDWNTALAEQLDWQWRSHLRPRLAGLTDDEYFWEPVPGCWNLRKRGTPTDTTTVGAGDYLYEFVDPEPDPPPVTTIAWRLARGLGTRGPRQAVRPGRRALRQLSAR